MRNENNPGNEILNKIASKRFTAVEKIVLIVLVSAIFAGANYFFKQYVNAIKLRSTVVETLIPPNTGGNKEKKAAVAADAASGENPKKNIDIRDPFLPSKDPQQARSVTEKKPAVNLNLSGILWDSNIPTAIINSKVVRVGDILYGKTIVDIDREQVILMEEGELLILKLRRSVE